MDLRFRFIVDFDFDIGLGFPRFTLLGCDSSREMAPHSEVDTVSPAADAVARMEAPVEAGPVEEVQTVERKTNGAHTNTNGDVKAEVANGEPQFDIPKTCKAGVVHNPGPDFKVVVEDVPVPEPGLSPHSVVASAVANHIAHQQAPTTSSSASMQREYATPTCTTCSKTSPCPRCGSSA